MGDNKIKSALDAVKEFANKRKATQIKSAIKDDIQ